MEISKKTREELRSFLRHCITRLGQTEGKRYFSLMIGKLENDLLNEMEIPSDMLLDIPLHLKTSEKQMSTGTQLPADIEELPVVNEKDDFIPVLEAL